MLEVGKIVNVHGIMGDLKILTWTDYPEIFCGLDRVFIDNKGEKKEYKIKSAKVHKGCVLAHFEGINDRNAAEKMKNTVLFALKDEIPIEEGSFFIADLIGLSVKTDEKVIGTLEDVFATGANDVYSVRSEKGKMYYIPAIPDVINEINLENGYILITPLDGLLEE